MRLENLICIEGGLILNLMFLNSLEKKTEEDRVRTAQVSIGEAQGTWYVMWSDIKEDGRASQESWYEGIHWDEMLAVFRERILEKQLEGFIPLLEMGSGDLTVDGRTMYIQRLHYYSEANSNEELYDQLRQWRLKQAGKEGKAPFIIATNRVLKLISTFVPKTEEELLQLPGIGKNKAGLYAADILSMTAEQEQKRAFPLSWVAEEVTQGEFFAWLLQEKERKRKAEADKQETKRKLLEVITKGEKIDSLQEQSRIQRRDLLLWIEELDREGYDLEPYIDRMLSEVPEKEREAAWQAFELQGDRYLKPILQAMYKQEELSAKDADRVYEWLRLLRLKFRRTNAATTAREAG